MNKTYSEGSMTELIAYREIMKEHWCTDYKPLNLTGRWKLESGPYYVNQMFVEHKGWLFKHWISENCIKFLPKETEHIFEC